MRALMMALAMASVAGAASAQMSTSIPGGEVRQQIPMPKPAKDAVLVAEDALKHELSDPGSALFRDERAIAVATVRRGPLAATIDGPVSIVCGEYSSQDLKGDYAWFFVAIKQGHVLWTTADYKGPGEAYYSCRGAGLAK